jgi:tol-pal system protein YbgF
MKSHLERIAVACVLALVVAAPAHAQKDRDLKIDRMAVTIEELKTEMTLLQRQVQSLQETLNKTTGEMNALIVQMSDNISSIRRAQSAVSTNTSESAGQVSAIGERMTATNQRMERLSEQFAELKKLIEDLPKQPVLAQITPGNAEQLFAAAYADYSRGNYDLAASEFRQYVEIYPGSELADNAQYWIGEILYAQKKLAPAAAEFERVSSLSPKGDKAAAALYKRGLILAELNQKEEAAAQFQAVLKLHPKTPEAELAAQQLQQLGPEYAAQPDPPRRTRRP